MAEAGNPKLRVVHLISDLDIGGAEIALARLLERSTLENTVISLTDIGTVGGRIRELGITVIALGMPPGRVTLTGCYRLLRLLRKLRPDVLQTWLYLADLVGIVVGKVTAVPVILWNLRCAALDRRDHSILMPLLLRLLVAMSRWPDAVVCNSTAGHASHRALGYRPRRWAIIPNGIDTQRFAPMPNARAELRLRFGIAPATQLVGIIARAHPIKDHRTFLRAAALLRSKHSNVEFLVAGRGIDQNPALKTLADDLGVGRQIHWLDEVSEPGPILAALDLAVLSSYSEAFPNVVAEAMACGVPVVSTDAGDAAQIIGDAAHVVPRRDPVALSEAMLRVLEMTPQQRQQVGATARARIIERYALPQIAARYDELYQQLGAPKLTHGAEVCAG